MSAGLLVPAVFAAAWLPQAASPDLARETQSLKSVCAKCHDLQIVMDTPMSYDAWHDTVQTMVDRGASGTDEPFDDIMGPYNINGVGHRQNQNNLILVEF